MIRTTLNTNETKTNERQATCSCCHNTFEGGTMYGFKATNRSDNKFQYICGNCITNDGYHSTASRTAEVVGKVNNGVICGTEFEMCEMDNFARNWFYEHNYKATNDGSLNGDTSCEMVSNPNKGFKAFTKQLPVIEKMLENGNIEIDSSCGTHFHVSLNNMITERGNNAMEILRRNRKNIFGLMEKLMLDNPQKTIEFFGRNFTHYASTFAETSPMSKYVWCNLTYNNNVEFRLNKFRNAEQYHKLCMFEIEVIKYIVTNIDNPKIKYSKMAKTIAKKLEKAWS